MSAENNFDVIVVGAGPAGLFLSKELANLKILVLDRKKDVEDVQYDTLASFIEPTQYGFPSSILNPIHQIYIKSRNRSVTKRGIAYIVNRKKLLAFIEAGARQNSKLEIIYGSEIKRVNFEKGVIGSVEYLINGVSQKATAKIFADCSGISAVLGSKIGLAKLKTYQAVGAEYTVPLKTEPNVADLFMGSNVPGGYGWIFPLNQEKAIVGYGTLSGKYYREVEKRLADMWQIDRVVERIESRPCEKHIAVLRTGKPLKKFVKGNLVLVGDTALQANPLVGEGVRFVIDSAQIAAKWIRVALQKNDLSLLHGYEKDWKRKYFKEYRIAFWLQRKLEKYTKADQKIDYIIKKLEKISDEEFVKLLSGDLSYLFLLRLFLKVLIF